MPFFMPSFVTTRDAYTPQQSSRVEAGYRGAPIYSSREMAKGVKIDPYQGPARGVAGLGQEVYLGKLRMQTGDRSALFHRTQDLWTGLDALKKRIAGIGDDVWKVAQNRVSGLPTKTAALAMVESPSKIQSLWDAFDKTCETSWIPGFDLACNNDAYAQLVAVMDAASAHQIVVERHVATVLNTVTTDEQRKIRDVGFQRFMELQVERVKEPAPVGGFSLGGILTIAGIGLAAFLFLPRVSEFMRAVKK